jgi:tRNA pseudouridine65 synthase
MSGTPLTLLHHDAQVVAIDKPSGLVVHRSAEAGERDNCMTRLRRQLGRWVWPVHRLDRGASGVLLFGLDTGAARALALAFAQRRVEKQYLAVVRGHAPREGQIDHALSDDMGGPPAAASTRFTCLAQVELPIAVGRYASARYSLVAVEPLTGRRHQIRRHLRHVGHPLVGDVTHGEGRHNRLFREQFGCWRLLLHACSLSVPHPSAASALVLQAPPPAEFARVCARLGWSDALARLGAHDATPVLS